MTIFHTLFMLYLYLCTPILFVELTLFLFYTFKNSPIPSESKDPVKLRLYHVASLLVFRLVSTEKLICCFICLFLLSSAIIDKKMWTGWMFLVHDFLIHLQPASLTEVSLRAYTRFSRP